MGKDIRIRNEKQFPRVKGITPQMIKFIAEASRDTYPNEFYARLIAKDGVICEFSIIRVISGRTHVIPFTHEEPPDLSLEAVGTAHSHPSGNIRPSEADLQFFRKMGHTHIIMGYPYTDTSWKAFNSLGEKLDLPVLSPKKKRHYL